MQRVDSRTTLNHVINDLADGGIDAAARGVRVKAHLDAFINSPQPAEALEQSARVFNQGLALPASWNAMRTGVGQVLVADARSRVPSMELAATVAEVMDMEGLIGASFSGMFAPMETALPAEQSVELVQGLVDSLDALCINPMVAYTCARKVSTAALTAYHTDGAADGTAIARHITSKMPQIVMGAQMGTLQPARPEEAEAFARARAFQQASGATGVQGANLSDEIRDLLEVAVLRCIVEASTPEMLTRLVAYHTSPEGIELRDTLMALAPALSQMLTAQLQARVPWLRNIAD